MAPDFLDDALEFDAGFVRWLERHNGVETLGLRADEEAWLAANVYAPRYRPAAREPQIVEMTWRQRHG